MELDSTTAFAIRGAAHAVKGAAETFSLWGRDALQAIERAAKAWERLAAEKLEEHKRKTDEGE